jgi:hypothetical protein
MKSMVFWDVSNSVTTQKTYSMALVCEQTMPTERLPLVGQLLRIEGVAWSAQQIPTFVNLDFLDRYNPEDCTL